MRLGYFSMNVFIWWEFWSLNPEIPHKCEHDLEPWIILIPLSENNRPNKPKLNSFKLSKLIVIVAEQIVIFEFLVISFLAS